MKALCKLRVAFDLSIVNPSYVILVSHSHKVVDFVIVVVSSEEDSSGLWRPEGPRSEGSRDAYRRAPDKTGVGSAPVEFRGGFGRGRSKAPPQ